MATSFDNPIWRFFRRIEEDRDFFQYYSLTDEQAMDLAKDRADAYLHNAIDRMMLDGQPEIDFSDTDEDTKIFNLDLTSREVFLLASLMYEYYLDKDISKIKTYNVNYTGTELRVFDPSNARSTFEALYEGVCQKNIALLDSYRSTDRNTGALRGIDYSSYDESEEA